MRMRIAFLTAAATVALTLAAAPAMAGVPNLSCGESLDHSVTMNNDIGPCPGNGLIVTADHITIDLGGHTITGASGSTGVLVGLHSHVTVRHGTIRQFNLGVFIGQAASPTQAKSDTVTGMRVIATTTGVFTRHADGVLVKSSLFNATSDGIDVDDASHDGLVTGNTVVNSSDAGIVVGSNPAVSIGITVKDNVVTGGSGHGINIAAAGDTILTGNNVTGMDGAGIHTVGTPTTAVIKHNVLRGNQGGGISGVGVSATVKANKISGNGAAGITVAAGESGAVLAANVLKFNTGDGILNSAPSTTIKDNQADLNGGFGIKTVTLTSTGDTGNTAHDNGNAAECQNISCG
jgi:parallel beta-helix repeat protein